MMFIVMQHEPGKAPYKYPVGFDSVDGAKAEIQRLLRRGHSPIFRYDICSVVASCTVSVKAEWEEQCANPA